MLIKGRLGIVVALAASTSSLVGGACGHIVHPNVGGIDMTVVVPVEAKVDELVYVVSGKRARPDQGPREDLSAAEVFEALVAQVPAGEDYQLDVSATSVDRRFTCKRSTELTVHKNAITRVHLALACIAADGTVVVDVTVGTTCKSGHLVTYTVAPLSASVGGTISLAAMPSQPDAGALLFTWSASDGSFADPSAAQTLYKCVTRDVSPSSSSSTRAPAWTRSGSTSNASGRPTLAPPRTRRRLTSCLRAQSWPPSPGSTQVTTAE